MDEVINVIIVLFVAVVVAGMILLFSQRTLTNSEQRLAEFGFDEDDPELQLITLSDTATEEDVKRLAEACVDIHQGTVEIAECFIIKGEIPDVSSLQGEIVRGKEIGVEVQQGATALFMQYRVASVNITG